MFLDGLVLEVILLFVPRLDRELIKWGFRAPVDIPVWKQTANSEGLVPLESGDLS